ncbi:hypothetical protein OPT61_g4598 [Boeremia exigua]|uniref:Uncharacterized protein n=1 Tax=Boeremia exigua TaxID=749465 RepID=A0ACC2IDI1_9PLEO|nr:hypothetical protein OPT61_g4598 [Boeremia exigua]
MALFSPSAPDEVWLSVFGCLGADATVQDWISVEGTCRLWRRLARAGFTEWIGRQRAGSAFGQSRGSAAELRFVERHLEVLRMKGCSLEVLVNPQRELQVFCLTLPSDVDYGARRFAQSRPGSFGQCHVEHEGWQGSRILLRAQWTRKKQTNTGSIVSDLDADSIRVLAIDVLPGLWEQYKWFYPKSGGNRGANWEMIATSALNGLSGSMYSSGREMATTELDGLITRTTVILEKPGDWEEWIFLQKDSADRHHLWSMVNPDLDETALEELQEPAAVEPEHYHDETEEDTGVVLKDMTTEEFQRYQQAERNYDRALAKYTIKRKAWLEEWLHVVRMCEAVNLPDVTSPRAQRDFLLAIKGLDDTWATTQQATLFRAQLNAQPIPTLDDLVAEFAMYWRSTKPVASSLGTFATLGIDQSSNRQLDSAEQRSRNSSDRRLECKCGLKHSFRDCWYLGGKGKPQGWTPKPEIQEKFGKAMESQSLMGRAMKAALKSNTGTVAWTAALSAPRQFDDRSPTIKDLDSCVLQLTMSTDCTNKQAIKPNLINRWILDPGSNTHVTNTRAYGWKKRADGKGDVVKAGDQELIIQEWGDVVLLINTPKGTEQIELTYVAYVPGFLTNVLTLEEAHIMWGHAGRQAINHLPKSVDGLQLIDSNPAPKWKDCETCIQSKLTKLVSQRPPREPATRPFERISIDLIQLLERGKHCYNGDQYLFHMVDQNTKWHEGCCIPDKTKSTLTQVFKRLLAKIERQFRSQVAIVRLDMETGYVELLEVCRDLGVAVEPRATEAQNGAIERAGRSLITQARAIRLHAGLPEDYANECVMSAIYLLNRTPVEAIGWSCPYTRVKGVKPSVAHLEVIGAKAYVLNEKLPRGAKLKSRALIGHLMGFDSTNIF